MALITGSEFLSGYEEDKADINTTGFPLLSERSLQKKSSDYQYISSSIAGIPPLDLSFLGGLSAIMASVVSISPATEAAF